MVIAIDYKSIVIITIKNYKCMQPFCKKYGMTLHTIFIYARMKVLKAIVGGLRYETNHTLFSASRSNIL